MSDLFEALGSENPKPAPVWPKHILIIHDEWGEDGDWFEIEHPECDKEWETITDHDGNKIRDYWYYDCAWADAIHNVGFETYFKHADDPDTPDYNAERIGPGRYSLEYSFRTYNDYWTNEYDIEEDISVERIDDGS